MVLADATIVVEATRTGGARITAEYALDYGRPVYALPGSRRNPAATGCNELLRDGALPLMEPADVLFAIGRGGTLDGGWEPAATPADPDERAVVKALAGEPATIDAIERRVEWPAERLGRALRALEFAGRVERRRGLWWPK
jgi:DNA processing protein